MHGRITMISYVTRIGSVLQRATRFIKTPAALPVEKSQPAYCVSHNVWLVFIFLMMEYFLIT